MSSFSSPVPQNHTHSLSHLSLGQSLGQKQPHVDEWEYTVLNFGSELSLRGRLGKYLTAVSVLQVTPTSAPVSSQSTQPNSSSTSTRSSFSYPQNDVLTSNILSSLIKDTQSQQQTQHTNTQNTQNGQNTQTHTQSFILGVEGQGVGELLDCFVFVNADNRDDISSMKYGMTVAIKAPAAKER